MLGLEVLLPTLCSQEGYSNWSEVDAFAVARADQTNTLNAHLRRTLGKLYTLHSHLERLSGGYDGWYPQHADQFVWQVNRREGVTGAGMGGIEGHWTRLCCTWWDMFGTGKSALEGLHRLGCLSTITTLHQLATINLELKLVKQIKREESVVLEGRGSTATDDQWASEASNGSPRMPPFSRYDIQRIRRWCCQMWQIDILCRGAGIPPRETESEHAILQLVNQAFFRILSDHSRTTHTSVPSSISRGELAALFREVKYAINATSNTADTVRNRIIRLERGRSVFETMRPGTTDSDSGQRSRTAGGVPDMSFGMPMDVLSRGLRHQWYVLYELTENFEA